MGLLLVHCRAQLLEFMACHVYGEVAPVEVYRFDRV